MTIVSSVSMILLLSPLDMQKIVVAAMSFLCFHSLEDATKHVMFSVCLFKKMFCVAVARIPQFGTYLFTFWSDGQYTVV